MPYYGTPPSEAKMPYQWTPEGLRETEERRHRMRLEEAAQKYPTPRERERKIKLSEAVGQEEWGINRPGGWEDAYKGSALREQLEAEKERGKREAAVPYYRARTERAASEWEARKEILKSYSTMAEEEKPVNPKTGRPYTAMAYVDNIMSSWGRRKIPQLGELSPYGTKQGGSINPERRQTSISGEGESIDDFLKRSGGY